MGDIEPAAVCVDGNAALRSSCCSTVAPTIITSRLLKNAGWPHYTPRLLVAFDNLNIPPARAAVHAKRARTGAGVVPATAAEQAQCVATGPLCVTWQALFASADGKRRAYALLVEALKISVREAAPGQHDARGQDDLRVTITLPYSTDVWVYPFGTADFFAVTPFLSYGEAEAQVVMVTEQLVRRKVEPIVVMTIDTDIILQMMGIWAHKVYINLARVWIVRPSKRKKKTGVAKRDMSECYRTIETAKKAAAENGGVPEQRCEYVSCSAVVRFLGPTVLRVLNSMVWMLLAGGVDYSNGIGGFGWYSATCLKQRGVLVVKSVSRSAIVVDIRALFRTLARCRNRKSKDEQCAEFAHELNCMLYCVAYYAWFDDGRTGAAGPRHVELVETGGCKRVSAFVAGKGPGCVTIKNTYPAVEGGYVPHAASAEKYRAYAAEGVVR